MQAFFTTLQKRWRHGKRVLPTLHGKTCLFLTMNAVIIAALLLDGPVGKMGLQPGLHSFGRFLTDLGKSGWIILISAFLLFEGWAASYVLRDRRERVKAIFVSRIGSYMMLSIIGSGLLANLLKRAIGRARPDLFQDAGIFKFSPFSGQSVFESFPSGHATTIGAFFAALAFLFPRYRIVFLACALWLGMTRVMVGAHYPSDVIAGLMLGAWFSFMLAIVSARYGLLFRIDANGRPVPRHNGVWN